MRIWIAISAYLLLAFAVCSVLLTLGAGLQAQWINLLIIALALHDIIYLRVAKTDPVRGYRHLAAGQFLIGLLVAALVGLTALAVSDQELWATIRDTLAQMPNLQDVPQAKLDETLAGVRSTAITSLSIGAAFIFVSQTVFALFVLRRAKNAQPK